MEQDSTTGRELAIGSRDVLTEILREGTRWMLAEAIEQKAAKVAKELRD